MILPDVTFNPDFGQVEDPAAIALDGFEIFTENKDYFIENNNIFDYRYAESTNIFFDELGEVRRSSFNTIRFVTKCPQNTTILGAAKFSGKTKMVSFVF